MTPFGHITAIDDPVIDLDLAPLKAKSIAWHWELMFTRFAVRAVDMIAQQTLLRRGQQNWWTPACFGPRSPRPSRTSPPAAVREAHRDIESGRVIGKVVNHSMSGVRKDSIHG